MELTDLGWNEVFRQHFDNLRDQGFAPARIARGERDAYLVYSEHGELTAGVSGKMRHEAESRADMPAVGDWVAVTARPHEGSATIHGVLPRKSKFSRKEAGAHTEEQVAAANVDTAFLVSGLDGDFNLRRVERYLTLVWDSGATPVIVLNKTDVCPDVEAHVGKVESVAFGVPVLPGEESLDVGNFGDYFNAVITFAMHDTELGESVRESTGDMLARWAAAERKRKSS